MSATTKSPAARSIVDDVLGRGMTREIWSASYDKALPISVQDFELSAVLPAVFYMFRFGHRRGKGQFLQVFGDAIGALKTSKKTVTIEHVANVLAQAEAFEGFRDDTSKAILGDLLLCFCLENSKRALGRHEQVQRVAPAHYMASWVDLPAAVSNLRYVPEMIVAMLADQKGQHVQQNQGDKTWFAIGRGFEDNVLLKAFHQGVEREGPLGDLSADHFLEQTPVGLDQLLMIRMAQKLGAAPSKLQGGGGSHISNQHPVAENAARHFSEDLRHFVREYAGLLPRHSFVDLLEACMVIGLTTIVTSIIELVFEWADTGQLRQKSEQRPTLLFVDCSNGVDPNLRALAEQSMDDFMRRIERFPVILMSLRLLDYGARYDAKLKKLDVETRPYATCWLNLLGELLHGRREEAQAILYDLERKSLELAERLEEDYPRISEMLRNDRAQPNPVWRLAEALTSLQGPKIIQGHLLNLVDSVLLTGRPNGLAIKRTVTRKAISAAGRKRREVRSLVFTDSVLDYLVHLHVLRPGSKPGYRPLPFREFTLVLRERYGLCVDQAPPGMTISNELLRSNRVILERRLRDLGLLAGVNDAESMKQLRPRFQRQEESNDGVE